MYLISSFNSPRICPGFTRSIARGWLCPFCQQQKKDMPSFTQQYQSMTAIDFTNLPYWDLCAALRLASKFAEWAADDLTKKTMQEGHRWFITQAFEKLSVQF